MDYTTAGARMPQVVAGAPHVFGVPIVFNLLAFAIVAVITVVLVWGIRESAPLQLLAWWRSSWSCSASSSSSSFRYVKPEQLAPFAPNGFAGIAAGAAIVFFAYIGFDAVSTTAEESAQSQAGHADRHHRLAHRLHGRLHRRRRGLHGHDPVPGAEEDARDASRPSR